MFTQKIWKLHKIVQKIAIGKIICDPILRDSHCNTFIYILPVIFFFAFMLFTLVGNFDFFLYLTCHKHFLHVKYSPKIWYTMVALYSNIGLKYYYFWMHRLLLTSHYFIQCFKEHLWIIFRIHFCLFDLINF